MSLLIREKFDGQDFKSLAHLVLRVSAFENQHQALLREKHFMGNTTMIDPYDVDSNKDDSEVVTAEWTWGKVPVSCPWVKDKENTNDFDVKKAGRIFDLLLERKQLRLPINHVIPSAEELEGIKSKPAKKPAMGTNGHPFLGVHMVEF
jgi:hypothetical protein